MNKSNNSIGNSARGRGWKYVLVVLMCCFLTPLHAQFNDVFTIPLSNPGRPGKLKVDIKSGSIRVDAHDGEDVILEVSQKGKSPKQKNSQNQGLRKIPNSSISLDILEDDNYVKIDSDSWGNTIHVRIKVPRNFDLKLDTYNDGDIVVTGVSGTHEVENYNGSISLKQVAGSVVASTYNGEVEVEMTSIDRNAQMAFTTYNGDIDLTLPENASFVAKMKTNNGDLNTDFDMQVLPTEVTQGRNSSGVYKVKVEGWVKGKVGTGGPEYRLNTYNGDIYIRKL
ncbi:DUF4097 family beta strand repeat-containing protein [Pontibacter sp. G13]|uniref:DUF4097 family beta strand repeat-containing protein n=1 Tax=Pontibacter sp. G13 TaxID=3074898 RepID=UPI00288A0DCA|nr:DUF4097 family beta strand repeat-containing protein [Pontibacter sp. G13]WNJ17293.1 DUF4097 family beta strand repeat-containing protein [Pontibacter sp. G13]